MTVKELKERLKKYPEHLEVFIAERKTEFQFGLINLVKLDFINFYECVGDEEPLAENVEVVIIDEE